MKTVQYYLKKLKTKKLVEAYMRKDPIKYNEEYFKNLTINQIDKFCTKKIKDFIKRLRTLKIKKKKSKSILFAFKTEYSDIDTFGIRVDLIELDEFIKSLNEVQGYAYEHLKHNEMLGFLVADTDFNKEHIYEIMAEFMYEASWFGLKQEKLKKHIKILKKADKDYKKGKTSSYKSYDEMCEELGIEQKKLDENEIKLKNAICKAQEDYADYSRNKELENLRESLGIKN